MKTKELGIKGQNKQVLDHLIEFGSITPMEAMQKYSIMRLGARCYDLKRQGYIIKTVMEEHVNKFGNKTRYARYTLVKED